MDIWNELTQVEKKGELAALVTVIRTKGSAPREVGAKMVVRADGSIMGTIGGSAVESLVIRDAQNAIKQGEARIVEYDLNDIEKVSTGMICGGKMEFFIEPLRRAPHLYIFGGGHVAMPLARMAVELGYPHYIFDDRSEFASAERFPDAEERKYGSFTEMTEQIELLKPACIIIITRSHETDYKVIRGIMGKPYDYLGMISSKKKRTEIFKKLEADGFEKDEIAKVHSPIGLAIGSQTPAEIAVSILAEIIKEYQLSMK